MPSTINDVAAGAPIARRELLIGGACLAAAGTAGTVRFASPAPSQSVRGTLEKLVPHRFASWRSVPFANVVIPTGEAAEDRTYDDVLTRYYARGSEPGVMLLVAYSRLQAGETGIHRPEVCYPAAGFRLHRWPDLPLVLPGMRITAPTFTAFAPERIEQMLYWSRIGRDFPTSSLSQRWTMLKQAVQGSLPDGVLVRMSTIQPDRAAGLRSLEQFARELLGGASPALSALLTGRR